jgi:hypothetical protein
MNKKHREGERNTANSPRVKTEPRLVLERRAARDGGQLGLCGVRRRHRVRAVAAREQDGAEGSGLGLYSSETCQEWKVEIKEEDSVAGDLESDVFVGLRRKTTAQLLPCGSGVPARQRGRMQARAWSWSAASWARPTARNEGRRSGPCGGMGAYGSDAAGL